MVLLKFETFIIMTISILTKLVDGFVPGEVCREYIHGRD
jgi:hypothetical protein